MGTGRFRGAAIAMLCVATAIMGGCGDGGGTEPALVAGRWLGTLSLIIRPNSTVPGALALSLSQEEAFVSGVAEWSPTDEALSVTGPIDGNLVTLNLHFRCTDPDTDLIRTEITSIAGTIDADSAGRSRIVFSSASGRACFRNGAPVEVSGGSGSVTRTTDDRPL